MPIGPASRRSNVAQSMQEMRRTAILPHGDEAGRTGFACSRVSGDRGSERHHQRGGDSAGPVRSRWAAGHEHLMESADAKQEARIVVAIYRARPVARSARGISERG